MPTVRVRVYDTINLNSAGPKNILTILKPYNIVKAPVLHLPNRDGKFFLECDSCAKHVGAVLYQNQNGSNKIVAFLVLQCQLEL